MYIAQTTLKGQIVIPVDLRRKYKIKKGSRFSVLDKEGEIVLKPLPDDPIEAACGFLKKFKGSGSFMKEFLKDKKMELEHERKKFGF